MWNHSLFVQDVKDKGGLAVVAASLSEDFKLSTLTAWYNKTRTPNWVSLSRIAIKLGFDDERYG